MDEMTVKMMDTITPALRRVWKSCYVTFFNTKFPKVHCVPQQQQHRQKRIA